MSEPGTDGTTRDATGGSVVRATAGDGAWARVRRSRQLAPTLGAVLVGGGVLVAAVVKARCGLPADVVGQYLQLCYSDVVALWFAEGLDRGAAPYLDHPVEYPVLTGLWMWLAAWPATDVASFFWWTVGLLVAAGAVAGAAVGAAGGVRAALVVGLAPTLWVSGVLNWDMPSVALAALGLLAHRRARDGWAGIALGLGAAAKLWPVLLLPGVALAAMRLRGRPAAAAAVGGATGAWLAVNLPVALSAPDGWVRFVVLNRDRAADWDSLWRVLGEVVGSPPEPALLNPLAAAVTALGIGLLLTWTVGEDPPASWHLVALPVVAWFLLAGKVWSPQFTLWLLPLLALARPTVVELVGVAAADVAVSLTRFPFLGGVVGLDDGWPAWPFEVAVVVRALVVGVVAVTAWRRGVHRWSSGAATRAAPRLVRT